MTSPLELVETAAIAARVVRSMDSFVSPQGVITKGDRHWQGAYSPLEYKIITAFGQVGGKTQFSVREVKINKSGRSIDEQCRLELSQKYTLKMRKEGYVYLDAESDSDQAAAAGAGDDPSSTRCETCTSILAVRCESFSCPCTCDEAGGRNCTCCECPPVIENTRPFVMLAKDSKKLARFRDSLSGEKPGAFKFPVGTQPKLDGIRCAADLDADGNLRLSSRSRTGFDHLVPLFESILVPMLKSKLCPPGTLIDGELIVPRLDIPTKSDFQLTTSMVRSAKKGTSEEAQKRLVFNVFGLFSPTMPDEVFTDRNIRLAKLFSGGGKTGSVLFVETKNANDHAEIDTLHDLNKAAGYEGTMLYVLSGVYKPGAKCSELLKVKDFQELEGTIVGVKAGKGGREVNAAIFEVKVNVGDSGKTAVVTMRPEGSMETRKLWLADPSLVIGKSLTYSFQETTDAGLPRFPVARAIRDYE